MEYSDHLVAFLDILGFSNLCMKSDRDMESFEKLKEIYEVCEKIPKSFKERIGKKEIKTIIVSDSIMLSLKIDNQRLTLEECANFFLACGQVQYQLALKGYWLRGGISFGKLYVNESKKLLFGPAFIKAVNLEKNVAKTPRIVVDTIFIELFHLISANDLIQKINSIYSANKQLALYNYNISFFETDRPNIQKDIPLLIDFINSEKRLSHDEFINFAKIISKYLNGPIEFYEKYSWLSNYILSSHRKFNLEENERLVEMERILT